MLGSLARVTRRLESPRRAFHASRVLARGKFFQDTEVVDGVAIIRFDGPEKMNVLAEGMNAEMAALWEKDVAGNADVKAVVLASGKDDNFIAGADIKMLKKKRANPAELTEELTSMHKLAARMKATGKPVVAAIHGVCMGGGLEMALLADYRVASSHKKTVMSVPEIKLGIFPGAGGTQHLPPLVGIQESLKMMTTGGNVKPAKALRSGLVDVVCERETLMQNAIKAAQQLAAGELKPKMPRKKKSFVNRLLEDNALGRKVVFDQAKKAITKMTKGKYPAAYAVVDSVEAGCSGSREAGLAFEAKKFVEMAQTPESHGMIGLYDATQAAKKFGPETYGEPKHAVDTVGVLGAGLMGAGIAQVTAKNAKKRVLFKDRDLASVGRGASMITAAFNKSVKKRRMTAFERDATMGNIVQLGDEVPAWKKHFGGCDMIIEAVFEDLKLKHTVIGAMEEVIPEHCIFATNTSAIPIADIAKGSKRPENVVGMHYFSPVPMMPLLEIIPHAGTADHVTAAAFKVGAAQGKTCIMTKDVPGFYVNRCFGPFLIEVQSLLQDGADWEELDKAIVDYGMPMGPLSLADALGVDVAGHVALFLSDADMGARMGGANMAGMQAILDAGFYGKKTDKGFFTYDKKGKKSGVNKEAEALLKPFQRDGAGKVSKDDMQMRIMTRFVNEAVMCLQDEIIADPLAGDIGLVMGTGFPPFMGGPFRMLDNYEGGAAAFHDTMCRYRDQMGDHFTPCDMLADYAKSGKKFHAA